MAAAETVPEGNRAKAVSVPDRKKQHLRSYLILKTERISFFTHFFGFLCAIAGMILLFLITDSAPKKRLVSLIYGFSAMCLFAASSLYHYFKRQENEVSVWRKLDHFAIFIMIAGTYTPITVIYLTGTMQKVIIIAQWALVFFGFLFKFFWLRAPRYASTLIYLLMGWMAVFALPYLLASMSGMVLTSIILGGVSYTIGAIFYMLKRPVFSITFGFHEMFHIFILLGAFFHFLAVHMAVS